MKTGRLWVPIGILLMMSLLAASCTNIFGFVNDDEKSPTERADDAIREGKYETAGKALEEASETDSYANYLRAKVALLEAGVDVPVILDTVEGQDASTNDNFALLDVIDDLSNLEKTAWYQANLDANEYLGRIWLEEDDETMAKDDIALDYTVSNMMSGVLGLRDTNRDGAINNSDFQLNLSFINNAGATGKDGFNLDGGSFVNSEGQTVMFDGLEVFLGDWDGSVTKIAALEQSGFSDYEPDDINPLLAAVMEVFDQGAEAISYIIEQETGTSFDPEEIQQYIDEAAVIINFYWYNDGIDNDGDGLSDEETINGEDDDSDGLIDEDSDWHPSDPTPAEDTSYIPLWEAWNAR